MLKAPGVAFETLGNVSGNIVLDGKLNDDFDTTLTRNLTIFLKVMQLAGDTTITNIINLAAGCLLIIAVHQDAAGNHTLAWPAMVHGGMTVSATAGRYSIQTFLYNGTILIPMAPGITGVV